MTIPKESAPAAKNQGDAAQAAYTQAAKKALEEMLMEAQSTEKTTLAHESMNKRPSRSFIDWAGRLRKESVFGKEGPVDGKVTRRRVVVTLTPWQYPRSSGVACY
ncbi:hypothetical protein Pst134EA_005568 [Puccinia striiformis f. sp. tritici]|uniref:hypothetical protein n=1 Tax=Puccinia striiformis f. sp. tritici TaxID=168172 RepID=UPI002007D923|nr:hypothetical protein Pst134EA_005568 [Puccinia striiformis f. sp. tritici]KAH9471689.1 hypothetical protein Pst134EA_005568 [Puccinia striiformis f. sp. tritici]